ncbi:MAG: hypothetical protein L0196_11360 [candidate division Zixibacteria bacterium]|nr:hypothetical protein [candidate division Zixibacteria bacterium]
MNGLLKLISPVWNYFKNKILTKHEEELLLATMENKGLLYVLSSDQQGDYIKIGQYGYFDNPDPSTRIKYLDAKEKLMDKGLIKHESGLLYRITDKGLKTAQKTKKQPE